jgi:DNA-binding winged helix-turn-helix (wHTH) protein
MTVLTGWCLPVRGFHLDRQSRVLFRRDEGGAFVPIALGSRAFDVLEVLLDRAGSLVLMDAFMAAVWPATAVEDINLNMQIAALRRVLDEGRSGRGYLFAGDAGLGRRVGTAAKRPAAAAELAGHCVAAVSESEWRTRTGMSRGRKVRQISALSRIARLFVRASPIRVKRSGIMAQFPVTAKCVMKAQSLSRHGILIQLG